MLHTVFIAGATGVLGRRLAGQLLARGHRVLGLARNVEAELAIRKMGAEPRLGDLFDQKKLADAMAGATDVIHAATRIPNKTRTLLSDWAENDRIRSEGTHALAEAAVSAGVRNFLLQSIVWVARPGNKTVFDEDSPPNPGPLQRSAVEGEQIVRGVCERASLHCAVLRCGWLYAADASHTRMFGEALAARRLPIVGGGRNYWHCLQADDAASAFIAALEQRKSGLWHVVDDEPVRAAEFLNEFAAQLGAPEPRHVPPWLVWLTHGRHTAGFFTASTRTTNARIREELGWTPRFSTYREGLAQVVDEWRREGIRWLPR